MDNSNSKIIVITGASGGIGAALALLLGGQGHSLVLGARREKELESVAARAGEKSLAVVTDVTRREDVERLRDAAIEKFGGVDVWVNNAGRGIGRKVMDMSEDELDEMLRVNLKSVFYGMQAIVPHFQERGSGRLINVSSFLGRVPLVSFRSGYNAAKHAVNALTANLRMDLAVSHPGIHVSLVMPGVVTTDFARNALGGSPMPPSGGGAFGGQTAEQVAEMIAGLIENPQAELYTNPGSADNARRYFEDVGAFEESMRKHF